MTDPKTEVEQLMNRFLPFGQNMLQQYGEFLPYGGAMTSKGDLITVAGYTGEEQIDPLEMISILKVGYREAAEKGEYKATALFYAVSLELPDSREFPDAIAVALDHKEHYSVTVFFPYKMTHSGVEFGQLFAGSGEDDIFNQTEH